VFLIKPYRRKDPQMSLISKKVVFSGLLLLLFALFLTATDAFPQDDRPGQEPSADEAAGQAKKAPPKPPVPPQQGGSTIRVGPGGQQQQGEAPIAAKIDDITAHRHTPLPYVNAYDERVQIDMSHVDFDADVVARVNGEDITQEDLQAYLVLYGGSIEVDRFITAAITEIGREKRIADGADPSNFEVSEEQIDAEIEKQIKTQVMMKQKEMPDLTPEKWREGIETSYGWERYRKLVKAIVMFEKVYIPEIPAPDGEALEEKPEEKAGDSDVPGGGVQEEEKAAEEEVEEVEELDPNLPVGIDAKGAEVNIFMPLITWNAMTLNERDRGLRDHLNTLYKDGQPIGDFLRPHFARSVKEALLRTMNVDFFYSGKIPAGVFARIGDRDIQLSDIYSVMKHRLTIDDKILALREILVLKAMDKELKAQGFMLSDEEFEKKFREHEAEYEGSIFPLEFIIRLNGYYSKYRYKNHYLRRAGFEKMIADDLNNDEVLNAFYESAARLLYENGSVKVKIIFFGLYDSKTKTYRENGWEWVNEQMDTVLAALKNGEDFDELSKKYEDPMGTFTTWDFEFLSRNHLRMALGDSPKSALISGYSLADYVFYRGETGEIVGPVTKLFADLGNPVHRGVYLAKIVEFRRSQYLRPFEQSKQMVQTDYADLRFISWAQSCLKKADVELTQKAK
jgi:hypothetical protein